MIHLDRCDRRRMAAVDLLLCPLPRGMEGLRRDLERLAESGEATDAALRFVESTPRPPSRRPHHERRAAYDPFDGYTPPTYKREHCSILFY